MLGVTLYYHRSSSLDYVEEYEADTEMPSAEASKASLDRSSSSWLKEYRVVLAKS